MWKWAQRLKWSQQFQWLRRFWQLREPGQCWKWPGGARGAGGPPRVSWRLPRWSQRRTQPNRPQGIWLTFSVGPAGFLSGGQISADLMRQKDKNREFKCSYQGQDDGALMGLQGSLDLSALISPVWALELEWAHGLEQRLERSLEWTQERAQGLELRGEWWNQWFWKGTSELGAGRMWYGCTRIPQSQWLCMGSHTSQAPYLNNLWGYEKESSTGIKGCGSSPLQNRSIKCWSFQVKR